MSLLNANKITGGIIMLDYISFLTSNMEVELLNGNLGIIGTLSAFPHLRQFITYNGDLDQFQVPISILKENGLNVQHDNIDYSLGPKSKLITYVDEKENFCFGIKTDW